MSTILIVFFISLAGISVMIGRKLILLKKGQIETATVERIPFEIPNLDEAKQFTVKKAKKYGYLTLVTSIRLSVRSSNIIKRKYKEIKNKIDNMINKRFPQKEREASKFLKTVLDYKNKIAEIRNQIIEEEEKK